MFDGESQIFKMKRMFSLGVHQTQLLMACNNFRSLLKAVYNIILIDPLVSGCNRVVTSEIFDKIDNIKL